MHGNLQPGRVGRDPPPARPPDTDRRGGVRARDRAGRPCGDQHRGVEPGCGRRPGDCGLAGRFAGPARPASHAAGTAARGRSRALRATDHRGSDTVHLAPAHQRRRLHAVHRVGAPAAGRRRLRLLRRRSGRAGRTVGLFQLHWLDRAARIAEWGFVLGAAHWGRGLFLKAPCWCCSSRSTRSASSGSRLAPAGERPRQRGPAEGRRRARARAARRLCEERAARRPGALGDPAAQWRARMTPANTILH